MFLGGVWASWTWDWALVSDLKVLVEGMKRGTRVLWDDGSLWSRLVMEWLKIRCPLEVCRDETWQYVKVGDCFCYERMKHTLLRLCWVFWNHVHWPSTEYNDSDSCVNECGMLEKHQLCIYRRQIWLSARSVVDTRLATMPETIKKKYMRAQKDVVWQI